MGQMHGLLCNMGPLAADILGSDAARNVWFGLQMFIGFSFIIFIHELGHFAVAKWAGVRVEQFAVGFFREVFGFKYGETRYSFNLLPLGGYVKMLGQEDFQVDTTGELQFKNDPRSFVNKPVGHRMAIISAGVIMNLFLAAALFMIVFMVGMEVPSARVGAVLPDRPAALAGIQSGDVVRKIEGTSIDDFGEISMAVVLSKPGTPLDFEIERAGEVRHIQVVPERRPENDTFQVGIGPTVSPLVVSVGPEYEPLNPEHPHVGDTIVEIAGREVTGENANELINLLQMDPVSFKQVVVERPVHPAGQDSAFERVAVKLQPRLQLRSVDFGAQPQHLLGLVPLRQFGAVDDGGRADLAGIEVGDVILEWDGIENPSLRQIDKSIHDSALVDPSRPERDIPIRVKRAATRRQLRLVVRPKVKIVPITGKRKPSTIDADYSLIADDTLRVGSVVPEAFGKPTPAKLAGIPAGAVITTVGGVKVQRWTELHEQFLAHAGEDVVLQYDHGGQSGMTGVMHVPSAVTTALGLGPAAQIIAVNGAETADVERGGRVTPAPVSHPAALRVALADQVGETVEITYRDNPLLGAETAEVRVTEEMLYPWPSAVGYTVKLDFAGETTLLRKSNPIDAVRVGIKKTYYFVMQVYQVMERMIFSRSLGVENISGPVGIIKIGHKMAEAGFIQLLYFMAIISANLAVINFLPLPIVDGGHMVFLIIEKIKGSPISVRIQVATQVIGLILIISAFLFVTLQDLAR